MSKRCAHCKTRAATGGAATRGLCDVCYASPAHSLYSADGRRVADFPPPPADAENGSARRSIRRPFWRQKR
jgi:hypothetical protein